MLHNIIYEVPIKNGLHASIEEKSKGRYIFRIVEIISETKMKAIGVANVSERGEFECYTEATKLDANVTIEDFRPLYEFLEFHLTWFKHSYGAGSRIFPYVINKEYVNRVYGSRRQLIRSQNDMA